MQIKKILLLLLLVTAFGTTPLHAQSQKKASTQKTVTPKKSKARKTKSIEADDGEYYNGHKIYTGPRGGRYYINRNGNKTYI
ncbi:hypothetical protein LQ567_18735 [Niabella pedocola]|uniref:PBCV-specific basic adaptor domain-containing protein n=1 Tax=Niabella pedocola TaxID=1752077 RepID=A0ABS8PUT4_9BACT|nr:hypothetical protein [Niabella pedocola]MCD2424826.1 hypothetical protein [Niabella pedocola]